MLHLSFELLKLSKLVYDLGTGVHVFSCGLIPVCAQSSSSTQEKLLAHGIVRFQ